MIVPVGEHPLRPHGRPVADAADRGPQRAPLGHCLGGEGGQARIFRPPLQEQVAAGLQGQVVIGQQGPAAAVPAAFPVQPDRRRLRLQAHQHVHGVGIEGAGGLSARDLAGEQVVPQVLDHGEALGHVQRLHLRRGQAPGAQEGGGGGEGVHPSGGEAGERIVAHGPALVLGRVRPRRFALRRGGGVHQDAGVPAGQGQALIAAGGGVPGHLRAHGRAEARLCQKGPALRFPRLCRGRRPIRHDPVHPSAPPSGRDRWRSPALAHRRRHLPPHRAGGPIVG